MKILFKYLRPYQWLIVASLGLAASSQLLSLLDPVIFGKIIDDYSTNKFGLSQNQLISEVIYWLLIALGIALVARICKSVQEFITRKAVAGFGMSIFNDGLKQTLRLTFQEFEENRSGTTLSVLQKVKTDAERFINAFINILFSSLVGVAFLLWYSINKNWLLVPVFFIGVLVLGSLTGLVSKRIKFIQRSINRQADKQAGIITESLRNIELV